MLGEFYKWTRCNFFMVCFEGIADQELWWSKEPLSMFDGAPFYLNAIMSLLRYRKITAALQFTNIAFNQNYAENYHPSWLNFLNESMSSWLSKFCLGFMCIPQKPHLFGNDYHSSGDGDDGKPIMWWVKIVEEKNRPTKADSSWVFQAELRKMMAVMLEMTKPIHGKRKVVVGNFGFCVWEGVIECHKHGICWFQVYIEKKWGNWPPGVPGDVINTYFDEAPLGHCETFVAEHDNIEFCVHCYLDSNFMKKIMSTHGMVKMVSSGATQPTIR
jgi:hypothetical protein